MSSLLSVVSHFTNSTKYVMLSMFLFVLGTELFALNFFAISLWVQLNK